MKIDLVLISSRLAEARRLQAVELAEAAAQTGIEAGRAPRQGAVRALWRAEAESGAGQLANPRSGTTSP
mgnify:CR=1 FL=1